MILPSKDHNSQECVRCTFPGVRMDLDITVIRDPFLTIAYHDLRPRPTSTILGPQSLNYSIHSADILNRPECFSRSRALFSVGLLYASLVAYTSLVWPQYAALAAHTSLVCPHTQPSQYIHRRKPPIRSLSSTYVACMAHICSLSSTHIVCKVPIRSLGSTYIACMPPLRSVSSAYISCIGL